MKIDEKNEIKKMLIIELERILTFLNIDDLIVIKFDDIAIENVISEIDFFKYNITFNINELNVNNENELLFNLYYDVMHLYHYFEIEFNKEKAQIKYDHKEKINKWIFEYQEMLITKTLSFDYDSVKDAIAFSFFYLKSIKNINIDSYGIEEDIRNRIDDYLNHKYDYLVLGKK